MINILLAIVVSASIDSTTLMLGDQTDLHLKVTHEASERVEMPVFGETLQDGIEIVDKTIVDTVALPDGRLQLHQYLTLTSFKDSLFVIAPIAVASGQDTFWTESLGWWVNGLDGYSQKFADGNHGRGRTIYETC